MTTLECSDVVRPPRCADRSVYDPSRSVRRDLFSVKVYDRFAGQWCHTRMFWDRESALTWLRGESRVDRSLMAKLVHPEQWVVDAYLCVGNRIY